VATNSLQIAATISGQLCLAANNVATNNQISCSGNKLPMILKLMHVMIESSMWYAKIEISFAIKFH